MPPAPVASPKQLRGLINAVPCPHCGKAEDYRSLRDLGNAGSQGMLETGSVVTCSHCGKNIQIVAVNQVTMVTVRQVGGGGRPAPRGPAPKMNRQVSQALQRRR